MTNVEKSSKGPLAAPGRAGKHASSELGPQVVFNDGSQRGHFFRSRTPFVPSISFGSVLCRYLIDVSHSSCIPISFTLGPLSLALHPHPLLHSPSLFSFVLALFLAPKLPYHLIQICSLEFLSNKVTIPTWP